MGKRYIITEEQYNMLLKENGVTLKADVASAGDVNKAVEQVKTNAQKQGIKNYNISIDSQQLSENNKLISKKKLQENRLRFLKENSKVYSVKDFVKAIKK